MAGLRTLSRSDTILLYAYADALCKGKATVVVKHPHRCGTSGDGRGICDTRALVCGGWQFCGGASMAYPRVPAKGAKN